ncbi:hypothetical protein V7O66_05435 [Methanolobus sp. ZRKC3]|uniref:hypothetical protein n=1 Tax=Methanolobus sp. ZRKC3 TaxID=3125786 RepID=UPI003251C09D
MIFLAAVISANALLGSDDPGEETIILSEVDAGNSFIDFSDDWGDETGIISKVYVGNASIEVSDDWNYHETVLIDYDELMGSADNGTLQITLLGEDIDIVIQDSSERRGKIWYKGFVAGSPEYNVDISIGDNEVRGSISTYDMGYNIVPTDVVINGQTIHLVVASDILDTRSMEKNYPIDPLTFEVINEDSIGHKFAVEVYDPYSNLIFNETYSLQPGETILSPEVSEQLGRHRYGYTLDNNETFALNAMVERAAELGSSEKVSFIFVNDPKHSMLISIEQA